MPSELAKQIEDPEQRHLHVSSQIRVGIPLQIRAMRESRGWTQTQLAAKLGTTQNAISRLENPATGKPNIATLERLAKAFDVGLLVRFVPFSQFVKTVDEMSNKSVVIQDYDTERKEGALDRHAAETYSRFATPTGLPRREMSLKKANDLLSSGCVYQQRPQREKVVDIGIYRQRVFIWPVEFKEAKRA